MFELGVAVAFGFFISILALVCLSALVAFIAESSYVDEVHTDDD